MTMPGTDTRHRADVLVEALPYIRRFAGKTVVVKYGGNAIAGTSGHDALEVFAQDIVLMRLVGMRPVVVHGGGPQISTLMGRLGKTAEFRGGLRVTDAETVDIARMVLVGQVNPQLVGAINAHGNYAVGVNGGDAGLLQPPPTTAISASSETSTPSIRASSKGCSPMSSSPLSRRSGPTTPARCTTSTPTPSRRRLPRRSAPEKLVYLTDVEGLRRDVDDPSSLIHQTTADELAGLLEDGVIAGGMIPKVTSCIHAVRHGVHRAHILDGRVPHVLLLEIFTDEGIGTVIDAAKEPADICVFEAIGLAESPFMPVFPAPQRMFVRGRGTELFDIEGQRYLDFLSGIAVTSLGHANPAVAAAISAQAGELLHVSNYFANPQATAAAVAVDELVAEAAGHHGRVFFANSGAEAIECAIKLARKHGGRGRHTVGRARSAASMAGRWPPWQRQANRASTNRSNRCQRASATSPGAMSTRSPQRSTAPLPPFSSNRSWARVASTRHLPATSLRSAGCATRPGR